LGNFEICKKSLLLDRFGKKKKEYIAGEKQTKIAAATVHYSVQSTKTTLYLGRAWGMKERRGGLSGMASGGDWNEFGRLGRAIDGPPRRRNFESADKEGEETCFTRRGKKQDARGPEQKSSKNVILEGWG